MRTIAGRYRLVDAVGAGGNGVVFRAEDLLAGQDVAVKLLAAMSADTLASIRREVSVMRMLRLPGVVRLRDDGIDRGDAFIVMDLVNGDHFPGRVSDRSWASVGPRAVRLLESLALVHAMGVIHHDLKPANVLVDDSGRPTILDFGVARGPSPDDARRHIRPSGTPRYLAPEQLTATPADVRADLYAVGVMLFEVLTGTTPHPADDVHSLFTARVGSPAPSVTTRAPDLPRRVALLVDRLLARRPEDRPQSALDALAELGEEGGGGHAHHGLPYMGGTAVVDALVDAAIAGRPLNLAGPRGSGRTRALSEAAERLTALGRTVVWAQPGTHAYESLAPLLGTPGEDESALRRHLAERFADGTVLVVDDPDRIDPASARLVADTPGPILAVGPAGLVLPDLSEADLRPLFHGPDRLLHLQEDGARELFARVGGRPARVAAEVSAWVGAGLAEWSGGRLVVRRPALQQLAGGLQVAVPTVSDNAPRVRLQEAGADLVAWVAMAWPDSTPELLAAANGMQSETLRENLDVLVELGALRRLPDGRLRAVVPDRRGAWPEARRRTAQRAIAAALPEGNPRRFAHLVAAGDFADAADEALSVARRLADEGQEGLLAGVVTLGLSVGRQAGGAEREGALMELLATGALRAQSASACEAALYELSRADARGARHAAYVHLLRAAIAAWKGRGADALDELTHVPTLDDEEVERWRQVVRVQVAASGPLDAYAATLAELEPWSRAAPGRDAIYTGWMGMLRYRQGRFGEAADLHARAAQRRPDRLSRLASMLNAASALMEDYRLAEAGATAREALELSRVARLEGLEARAEWVLRSAAWRAGEARVPDLELVDAAVSLHQPSIEAQICLTEAAVAWRAGALGDAVRVANNARDIWDRFGFVSAAALAEALALLCDDEPEPGRVLGLARKARAAGPPRLTLQTLGLLGLAAPELSAEWWPDVRRMLAEADPLSLGRRNEVLALDEVEAYCSPQSED